MSKRNKRNRQDTKIKKRKPKYVILGLLILPLIFGWFYWRESHRQPLQTSDSHIVLASFSHLDFKGMEPEVAEKIQALYSNVKNNPESAEAWGKFGMNLYVHDFKDLSVQAYREAEKLDPYNFHWPYYLALFFLETGSSEAIPELQKALNLKPDYAPAHLRLGEAFLQSRRLKEATDQFRSALSDSACASRAFVGLVRVDLAEGNLESALANLQKTLENNPRYGEAYGLLSEVQRRLNHPQDAEAASLQAERLPKKTVIPDPVQAELTSEGVSSYWYELRGRSYLQQGNYAKAISELQRAAASSKNDARLYDELGTAYFYAREFERAAQQYRAAVDLRPDSEVFRNHLSTALDYVQKEKKE